MIQKRKIFHFSCHSISINEGYEYKWYGNIHIYLDKYLFVFSIQPPFIYKAFRFTRDFNGGYQQFNKN